MKALRRIVRRAMGRPDITLIGHSHVWALAAAAEAMTARVRIVDLWKVANPFQVDELQHLDAILPPAAPGPVVSLIGGSRYNTLALYEHPEPFDFVDPSEDVPMDPARRYLPYDAVREALLALMDPNLSLMRAVRERTRGRMYHLEHPPPWGDARDPKDYPADPWMQPSDRFGDRRLRRKLARLETRVLQAFCQQHDIMFLPAPTDDVADRDGFLRPDYFGDLMHVNPAYGRVALAYLLDQAE